MNKYLLSALLTPAVAVIAHASTLNLPDVEAAKAQAAENNKPALIIWYGSDWQRNVDAFVADWQKTADANKDTYVFGQFDDKTGQCETVNRNKVLPIEHFNLPAIVLLAQDGSYMTELSGQELPASAQQALAKLESLAKCSSEFAALVKQAQAGTGTAAVEAAAKALSMLPIKDAMRNKVLTTVINKQDPQDAAGYRAQFCFDHLGMYAEINGILKGGKEGQLKGKGRKFDDAEAYVRKVLGSPVLQGVDRRQQWLAGLAYVQRERILSTTTPENRDLSPMLATLKEIIDLAPESQYGIGATKFLHYWSPDTFNTITSGYYTRGDQTLGFEKDWHVDVTESIDGPGVYTFSLIPVETGKMISRNFRLAVNGQVVAKADIPETQDTKTVDLNVPAVPKDAKVEVWLTAKCQDHWMEATGFIEMKKK